jgi:uncharacterized protein YjiK
MKLIESYLLRLLIVFTVSCSNSSIIREQSSDNISYNAIGYNLSGPDEIFILPDILHEISGITAIDSLSIACVQDENGAIFVFDLLKNKISNRIVFNTNGDYEGIAQVNNTFYILRSDGVLFETMNVESTDLKKEIFHTGIPAGNNEGLCYDKQNNRLLIAPKDNFDKETVKKGKRPVYGFDLLTNRLINEPVFNFDLSDIKRFESESTGKDLEKDSKGKNKKKKEKNDPNIEFKPSEISIHPLTKDLYILSGSENMLFVFDPSGTIKFIEKLRPELLSNAEGITFLNNGDLFISNEGQNRRATLLRFNYKK